MVAAADDGYVMLENGVYCRTADGRMRVEFVSPDIVRVRYTREADFLGNGTIVCVERTENKIPFQVASVSGGLSLQSDSLEVRVDLNTCALTYKDARTGKVLLSERQDMPREAEKTYMENVVYDPDSRRIEKTADGEKEVMDVLRRDTVGWTWKFRNHFCWSEGEALYGLGCHMEDFLDLRGKTMYLCQHNLKEMVPVLNSTAGYGLLFDAGCGMKFQDGAEGGFMEWEAAKEVDYYFMKGSETDGNEAIRQMRMLTGQVPMIPLWAYGYFQSKERYASADETMGVAAQYRRLKVPLDCVVQDWQYWGGNNLWNAMEFSNPEFSNYQEMIDSVHRMDAHLLISTWANFGPDTKPYRHFKEQGQLIRQGDDIMTDTYPSNEGVAVYDTYSASARDAYWKFMYDGLISKGIDGYWLDSSEPDHYQGGDDMEETFDFVTGMGCTWRSVRNAYPLVHVGGVYDHHRAEPALADKRCVILTRSAYAGQQRYGANTWSADITASWTTFQNQIPAALNLTASGNPNWNSDIGAFFNGDLGGPGNEEYNELYARWFQFATFCPMMRSHGAGTDKAIYVWGKRGTEYFDNVERYINLRYALLPYIYSLCGEATQASGSIMRPFVMDFPRDKKAIRVDNEYMFGRNLLVMPVTDSLYTYYDTKARKGFTSVPNVAKAVKNVKVYLPQGAKWYNFWTNEQHAGGQTVNMPCPIDIMPVYVKAGSILPFGPAVQYATEKKWDNLEIRIYPGADGEFTLYEDEGDNYNYENGAFSQIRFRWNDATRTLTIDDRKGEYKGMLKKRNFRILVVDRQSPSGDKAAKDVDRDIRYNGKAQSISF